MLQLRVCFFCFFPPRWILSQAKKDGIDEEIAKYDGELSARRGPNRVNQTPARFPFWFGLFGRLRVQQSRSDQNDQLK